MDKMYSKEGDGGGAEVADLCDKSEQTTSGDRLRPRTKSRYGSVEETVA